MPYHNQFSDSVFMGTTIAAQAGALTGDRKYFDLAARHLKFMQGLDLRADGLYRHQPATDAAWGRGNAFAALGVALTLTEVPRDHPAYTEMLRSYREHMAKLFALAEPRWVVAQRRRSARCVRRVLGHGDDRFCDATRYRERLVRRRGAVSRGRRARLACGERAHGLGRYGHRRVRVDGSHRIARGLHATRGALRPRPTRRSHAMLFAAELMR